MSMESDETLPGQQGNIIFMRSMLNLFPLLRGEGRNGRPNRERMLPTPCNLATKAIENGRNPMAQKRRPLWASLSNRMAAIFRKGGSGKTAIKGIGGLSL